MKKYFFVFIMLFVLFTMMACAESSKEPETSSDIPEATTNPLDYDHSSNYVYSGFSDIPDGYSAEGAKASGCFVIQSESTSSSPSEVAGAELWQSFLDKTAENEAAFLRVAHFIGSDYSAFSDLYYSGGKYYLYQKDEYGIHTTGPYKYLRKLEGVDGIPPKDSYFYVLTDSLELTFEDVRHAMFASDLRTVTKIPYKWLGFTTYLD